MISATALCATAWLRLMVDGLWLMAYGFDLEKFPFGGGNMESGANPVPWIHPPPDLQKSIFSFPGPLKINIYAL